jgi:hypothetical protein
MTILEGMLPPPKPRNEALERLIELTGQRVTMAETADLARLAAHEYDEEVMVPEAGSAGERFLRDVARVFVCWINQEGRFPVGDEAEAAADDVDWHREQATGSQVVAAFVDLGLYYSAHADVARGATIADFQLVLDAVAEELIFTLAQEYAP